MVFENREQAGRVLARELVDYYKADDTLVLAIPRGGVIVGAELANELELPLDVVVTKKIGAPNNPELAIGALAEDGDPILDRELMGRLGINKRYIEREIKETKEKKVKVYIDKFRGGRKLDVRGKRVIVTDDGVATGSTLEAALSWLGKQGVKEIILAIPTGANDSMQRLEKLADKTICLDKPLWFAAVGQFYKEFGQVVDDEVVRVLEKFSTH